MVEEEISRFETPDPEIVVETATEVERATKSTSHADVYAMYMRYIPVSQIAKETGVSRLKINALIKRNDWKRERESLVKDIRKAVKMRAIARLTSINENGLAIVDAALKNALRLYKQNKRAPSLTEAEIIMKIVKGAHVLAEKEGMGDRKVSDDMTPDAVLGALMEDPYMRKAFQNGTLDMNEGEPDADTFDSPNSDRSAAEEARALIKRAQ